MLTMSAEPDLSCLVRTAELVGHPLSGAAACSLACWAELVIEWRKAAQLTSLRSAPAVVEQLMVPALYAMKVVDIAEGMHIVDFGCGNGCTGIALALASGTGTWSLVDHDEKKITFCRYALARCRIEEAGARVTAGETVSGPADIVLLRGTPRSKGVREAAEGSLGPGGVRVRWLPDPDLEPGGRAARCGDLPLWVVAGRANVSRETLEAVGTTGDRHREAVQNPE